LLRALRLYARRRQIDRFLEELPFPNQYSGDE